MQGLKENTKKKEKKMKTLKEKKKYMEKSRKSKEKVKDRWKIKTKSNEEKYAYIQDKEYMEYKKKITWTVRFLIIGGNQCLRKGEIQVLNNDFLSHGRGVGNKSTMKSGGGKVYCNLIILVSWRLLFDFLPCKLKSENCPEKIKHNEMRRKQI